MSKPYTAAQLSGFIAKTCGVTFSDTALLMAAFTHRSLINEVAADAAPPDNERLEFLGDSVVYLIATRFLYDQFPNAREGALTDMRSALVRNKTLASFANDWGLGAWLALGKGELQIGGQQKVRNLGGLFEALIGALYLDQGLRTAEAVLYPLFARALTQAETDQNWKSQLQEFAQSVLQTLPQYHYTDQTGELHAPTFTAFVSINDQVWGTGLGSSKQKAAQAAAAQALSALKQQTAPNQQPKEDHESDGQETIDHGR
jgi:ribonuclease III